MSLQDVEAVSITILMDNCTDFLLTNSAHARRPPLIVNEKYNLPAPIAEHGFSALISTFTKNNQNIDTFLFDAGVSENGVIPYLYAGKPALLHHYRPHRPHCHM